ncbi:hypothetical protein ACF0H5_012316 [Mactra antiquata]
MGLLEPINRLRCFLAYWYLQWELNTSLYMLEPAEKYIVNSIAVAIIGVIVLAALTYLPGHLIMMIHFMLVPCFPRSQPQVVQPQDTAPYKNVQRYGETNIRRANAPLKMDQWKKNRVRDPNQGRPLPAEPQEHVVRESHYQRLPPQDPKLRRFRSEEMIASTPKEYTQPQPRQNQPIKADFFVSVPIFTETLDHSFRKKNEFVYVDRPDDETSIYHQSLSRGSSLRDLRPGSARRPPIGYNTYSDTRQTASVKRHRRTIPREHRRRHYSGSEASYNTFSSRGTYGYESETFENARVLQSHKLKRGLNVESDDDDYR